MKPSKLRRRAARAHKREEHENRLKRMAEYDAAKKRLDAVILARGGKQPKEMSFSPNNRSKPNG